MVASLCVHRARRPAATTSCSAGSARPAPSAAFARVHYVLFPSLYTDWLYTGDLLRIGFYVLLLVGAAREIGQYWSAQARAAVLEDRRRLARELHDGVVQELGYIRVRVATRIGATTGCSDRILGACDRALDEARAAVEALGRSPRRAARLRAAPRGRQVAERYGGRVVVDLDDAVDADPEQRHALVRITREAVVNAVRHGRRGTIHIRLVRGRRTAAGSSSQDDGQGFDSAGARREASGYGLISMRERAAALPGVVRHRRRLPGDGTTVRVTW